MLVERESGACGRVWVWAGERVGMEMVWVGERVSVGMGVGGGEDGYGCGRGWVWVGKSGMRVGVHVARGRDRERRRADTDPYHELVVLEVGHNQCHVVLVPHIAPQGDHMTLTTAHMITHTQTHNSA